MAKKKSSWSTARPFTLKLKLDSLNDRIEILPKSSPKEIRAKLLETERIVELANNIVASKGLMAGERIIVLREENHFVVLEGNRRTCACQMLLDRTLVPENLRSRFPTISEELKQAITRLDADVAPSREAAEIVITRRHTEPGIEQWSPMAKQRRVARQIAKGKSIDEISVESGMKKALIVKSLREYNLLNYAKELPGWKVAEKTQLASPTLKPNAFVRFFTLKGSKKTIDLKFDPLGNLQVPRDKKVFDAAMHGIARGFLIRDAATNAPLFNTRDEPAKVFGALRKKHEILSGLKLLGVKRKQNRKTVRPKSQKFFEHLQCSQSDDRLIQLAKEISNFNYGKFPIAASFLIRALVDRSLRFAIEFKNLDTIFRKEYFQHSARRDEPGLEFLVNFCIKHDKELFVSRKSDILKAWKEQKKSVLDLIIHGNFVGVHSVTVEQSASFIRDFIQQILDGRAFEQETEGE